MSQRHLSPRTISRALDLLLQLPTEAQADMVERLIKRLDAAETNSDSEPDHDDEFDQDAACACGDDDPKSSRPDYGTQQCYGPGDFLDGGPDEDAEPNDSETAQHLRREVLGMESWTRASL